MTDAQRNNAWFVEMYNSTKELVTFAMVDLGMTYEAAREYAKERSCAGRGVWLVLDGEFNV